MINFEKYIYNFLSASNAAAAVCCEKEKSRLGERTPSAATKKYSDNIIPQDDGNYKEGFSCA